MYWLRRAYTRIRLRTPFGSCMSGEVGESMVLLRSELVRIYTEFELCGIQHGQFRTYFMISVNLGWVLGLLRKLREMVG
jgi:hypothetical protein